ncbi:hypothetical protein [Jeotgalibacillus marinus]|uniref:Uncharacterized protein n=1 Tax=Jeotgalibacillus marinus TaxID=86667 RepID=A0ABV3Q786_9BACL
MTKTRATQLLSVQEEQAIELPLDGKRVEVLRLRIPNSLKGRQVKLDGFFQSNFFVADFENDDVKQANLPYKYEIAYQVMTKSEEGNMAQVSPILLDTVSGVQQFTEFSVEHNTNPNFTIGLPCVAGDIVLMASVVEVQGGVAGAFVNTRSMNATVF